MKRKTYNKLIRDKIPKIIKRKGDIPKFSIMNDSDFQEALKIKMTEEAKELAEAKTKDEVLNELSNIQELIAIAGNYKVSLAEIEKQRKKKSKERGGFKMLNS